MAKVILSLPEQLLAQIDKVAETECRSRSELLRESFRLYTKLNMLQRQEDIQDAQKAEQDE